MLKINQLDFLEYHVRDFEIPKPGLYGFIGQNGSGKSTFFGILNHEVIAKNSIISSEEVMYLSNFQSFDKNLKGSDYFKILSKKEQEKAFDLVKKFGADAFIHQKIDKYSLGMLQQFAIIVSLSVYSEIIILDEIHSGLDIKHQAILFEELDKEKERKLIFLTSHYLEDIEKHCERSFFLDEELQEVSNFSAVKAKILGG